MVQRTLPLLPLALAPAVLLRGSLAAGHFPGQTYGEGWGRLFAIGQVSRWLTGTAPVGRGDLLAHPDGMTFWPVDPLTTGAAALLQLIAGGDAAASALALTTTFLVLLTLTGLGAWILARSLGASPWGASAGALALQLHPFVLRSAADSISEVLALGPLLLLGAAAVHAWRGGRRRWWLLGGAAAATALTSPYFAVYGAIFWVGLLPWAAWRREARRWAGVAAVPLVVFSLVAAPLVWAEHGPGGRLDERFTGGGFQLAPSGQVMITAEGGITPAPRPRPGSGAGPTSHTAAKSMGAFEAPSRWMWLLHRFPGGLACALAGILGLASRRSRPWALLALVMLALGAGPPLVKHVLTPGPTDISSPLQDLLQLLPLTDRLGNAQRLVILWAIPACIAGGIATARRWPLAVLLALVTITEAQLVFPELRLPTSDVDVDTRLMDAIQGPVVTFPRGDPPLWNPSAAPKRSLFLATLHGGAVAADYGRGRTPADLDLVATLASWSAVALSPEAAHRAVEAGLPAPDPEGFGQLLVLHESLNDDQRRRLHDRARARWGEPEISTAWGAVYRLGD